MVKLASRSVKSGRFRMRRLGLVWQWGWALGFAFLAVYIAFDVLDVDGSQLRQHSGLAITAESSSAEADRVLRESALPPLVFLHPRELVAHTGLRLHPAGVRLRPLRENFFPRRHLARLDSLSPEQPADPA
jgi:hypothetical protein